jgi:hypothetical protein
MKSTKDMTAGGSSFCTAFEGSRRIASGKLVDVAAKAKAAIDRGGTAAVLIFDDQTSQLIEVDFRGTEKDVLQRLTAAALQCAKQMETDRQESAGPRAPGRPKLGVVAREVTLLPRHWEWLNSQPGGASVALRKLVEEARRVNAGKDRVRQAREVAYRFLSAMAGNEPFFEEATRSLFAGDAQRFEEMVSAWPVDIREHAKKLAADSFVGLAESD